MFHSKKSRSCSRFHTFCSNNYKPNPGLPSLLKTKANLLPKLIRYSARYRMARLTQGPITPRRSVSNPDSLTDLTRLLGRLQQSILHADAERERRLRTSEHERNKAGIVSTAPSAAQRQPCCSLACRLALTTLHYHRTSSTPGLSSRSWNRMRWLSRCTRRGWRCRPT